MNNLKIESYRKGIVLSSFFNILSKLLLFSQNLVLAYYFGTQAKVDIYFYCFTTITLVATFISMLNGTVLIPESMRLSKQFSQKDSNGFLNVFIFGYVLLGLSATVFLLLYPIDIYLFISNFDKELLVEYHSILVISIPLFTLMILSNILVEILSSHKYFTAPQMVKMLNSISGLTFLFLFHDILDIKSLLLGLIAGYSINIIFLTILMKKQLSWSFKFRFYKIEKRVLANSLYAILGNIASAFASYFPMYIFSGFSSGVIAALNYGQRTANLPTNSITQQFSPVMAIKFNELYVSKKFEQLADVLYRSANTLLFILTPISVLLYMFGQEFIILLYERGAFDKSSTELSGMFLKILGLTIPFIALNNIVARLFMSAQKVKEYFWYQILKNVLLVAIIYFGIKEWGAIGYPISLLILNVLNVFASYLIVNRKFSFIDFKTVLFIFLKIIIVNSISAVLIYYLLSVIQSFGLLTYTILCSGLHILIVLLINKVFVINSEINNLMSKVVNRIIKLIPVFKN